MNNLKVALNVHCRDYPAIPICNSIWSPTVIITLGDLYPTCVRCGGECVALRCCSAHPAPFGDFDEDLEYVPCPECNGLGGRLGHGGKLLLEIMRLSNPMR